MGEYPGEKIYTFPVYKRLCMVYNDFTGNDRKESGEKRSQRAAAQAESGCVRFAGLCIREPAA
jgi:hypothetical protein